MDQHTEHSEVAFLRQFLELILTHKDQLRIERRVDELGVLVTLQVAKDDMGKIIGKEGRTAKALRVLLRMIGSLRDERVNLKILDPEGREAGAEHSGDHF